MTFYTRITVSYPPAADADSSRAHHLPPPSPRAHQLEPSKNILRIQVSRGKFFFLFLYIPPYLGLHILSHFFNALMQFIVEKHTLINFTLSGTRLKGEHSSSNVVQFTPTRRPQTTQSLSPRYYAPRFCLFFRLDEVFFSANKLYFHWN